MEEKRKEDKEQQRGEEKEHLVKHLVQHFKQFRFAKNKQHQNGRILYTRRRSMGERVKAVNSYTLEKSNETERRSSALFLADSPIGWPLTSSIAGLEVKCLAQGHLSDGCDRSRLLSLRSKGGRRPLATKTVISFNKQNLTKL